MAWIAMLAQAAVSAYSANKQNQAAKKVGNEQSRLYGIQADTAEKLQPYALDYYRKSSEALDPALSHYRALASGDSAREYGAIAPELSSIGSRYRSLIGATSELQRRGGMSSSYAAELPFRALDEKQALLSHSREGAYGNLANLGLQAGNLGAGAAGGSQNAAAGAGNMLNNSWMMQSFNGANRAKAYGEVGDALLEAWKAYRNRGSGTTASDNFF